MCRVGGWARAAGRGAAHSNVLKAVRLHGAVPGGEALYRASVKPAGGVSAICARDGAHSVAATWRRRRRRRWQWRCGQRPRRCGLAKARRQPQTKVRELHREGSSCARSDRAAAAHCPSGREESARPPVAPTRGTTCGRPRRASVVRAGRLSVASVRGLRTAKNFAAPTRSPAARPRRRHASDRATTRGFRRDAPARST